MNPVSWTKQKRGFCVEKLNYEELIFEFCTMQGITTEEEEIILNELNVQKEHKL